MYVMIYIYVYTFYIHYTCVYASDIFYNWENSSLCSDYKKKNMTQGVTQPPPPRETEPGEGGGWKRIEEGRGCLGEYLSF